MQSSANSADRWDTAWLHTHTPLDRVYRWEAEQPSTVFLTQPLRGQVRDLTWAQTMDEVRRVAAWLRAQQYPPGSRVVILSKNSAWWIMAELAAWMTGHVTVPIYPSLTAGSVRALMDHCEPVACFLGTIEDRTILTDGIPEGVARIGFPTAPAPQPLSWDSIVSSTPRLDGAPRSAPDDLATIIYTSGTTGRPKGAMHRFGAFSHFVAAGLRVYGAAPDQRVISYLPLAHIAERALVEMAALFLGYRVFFVESLETFRTDLKRARPTIFFSVPRLFTKFQQGVLEKIPQKRLDRWLRTPIFSRIVRRRILRELGLDAARIAASGGAALPLATLHWFRNLGLNLTEGYGMTETGITHTPERGESRPGFVGNSVPGVETRLSAAGEVEVRSSMNMLGYYKDPDLTRAAFTEDGFFRTGDLGELDGDGWLRIIGRVKEQFKTSKGKYISPGPLEKLLCAHAGIEACFVTGSDLPKCFAIVMLSEEWRGRCSQAREECEQWLGDLLREVNQQVDGHERLAFLVVTSEAWTIGNGLLTPTMKLRRAILEEKYGRFFPGWSEQGREVVWHTADARVGVQA
jgi:long-chain acyl-CoA synthetase